MTTKKKPTPRRNGKKTPTPDVIEEAVEAAQNAPAIAPTDLFLTSCHVDVVPVTIGERTLKGLLVYHANGAQGVRFVLPLEDAAAVNIGDQLCDRATA